MDRVRVLAMDHFFDQDLRALEGHPGLEVRRIPYQRLRGPALRIMGELAADGLRGYTRPELEPARLRYASWLRREVRRLYLERPFDVFVLPSDTFFYVRSLPDALHALGLPVAVVQKETTISADTMEAHSRLTREHAPFIADHMMLCSERQREFWLRAGADETLIEVTGQPRFDVYAERRERSPSSNRRVLFLSYELDAYVPESGLSPNRDNWRGLRDETEGALLAAVRAGDCEVVVKCHPQQHHRREEERLSRAARDVWNHGLSLAEPDADTRLLIVGADVVVGFQTTALYEAVAAGRPVIVAAWGDEYDRFRDGLIPFDRAPAACVHNARSPAELAALLVAPLQPPVGCAAWYEDALGRVDGLATARVASRLGQLAAAWPPTMERLGLERRHRRFAAGLLLRSTAAEMVWTAAIPIARIAGQERRVAARRRRARDHRRLAARTLRGRDLSVSRGGG